VTIEIPTTLDGRGGPAPVVAARAGGRLNVLSLPAPSPAVAPATTPGEAPDKVLPALLEAGEPQRGHVTGAEGTVPEGDTPAAAPMPLGSGLITGLFPSDLAGLERSLSQFLDRLGEEGAVADGPGEPLPWPVMVVAAIAAFEVGRRWRQRLADPDEVADPGGGVRPLHGLS
jgi:hypothetical protein